MATGEAVTALRDRLTSLATQNLVIFAIRTRRSPFFRSRPGVALTVGTIASVAVVIILPYTPLAGLSGFSPLPLGFLAILAGMVVIYLALVELGKALFFGRRPPRAHLPIARWRQPPAIQRTERLASRWTVRPRAGRGLTR